MNVDVEKNILLAFVLNLCFSIFEFIGGIMTGSVAIMSDSIHDLGDAVSIGISYILEKKSNKKPDKQYSFGYKRYSVLGGAITTCILISGSLIMLFSSCNRLVHPVDVNYNKMLVISLGGIIVNFIGSVITHGEGSLNQKSVNIHMLEDVLGWIVIFIGSIIMHFTDIKLIDPILSIIISVVILVMSIKNFKKILDLFLEKVPDDISLNEITKKIKNINGVEGVHHLHVWSIDGYSNYATMHVIVNENQETVKSSIRSALDEFNIKHVTIEIENIDEKCEYKKCKVGD